MRIPFLIGWGVTVLWMIFVGSYVGVEIGWENLFIFLPHELGGFVIGAVTPPAFLWLVIAFLFRESEITAQSAALLRALRDITEPNDESTAHFRAMLGDLMNGASALKESSLLASQGASELGEAIYGQVAALNQVSSEVADRMAEMEESLQHQLSELCEVSDRTAARADDIRGSIRKEAKGVKAAMGETMLQTKAGMEAFQKYSQNITATAEAVRKELETQSGDLKQASDTAIARMEEVIGSFRGMAQELLNSAHRASTQLGVSEDGLRDQLEGLVKIADQATARIKETRDALRDQSFETTTSSNLAVTQSKVVEDVLNKHFQGITQAWEGVMTQVREIGESFRNQTEELSSASDKTTVKAAEVRRQLQAQAQDLEKTVQMITSASKDVEDAFRRQVKGLISASDEAVAQAKHVTKSAFDVRRGSFLRSSSFIIEKLNSLAIDVNRLLETSISEAAWKKFLKGDRGIFTRLLYGKGYMEIHRRIRERFKNDEDLRRYVTEYMTEFRGLLEHARTLDHSNVLESTFLSADVGKLYLLLKRSLEDDH